VSGGGGDDQGGEWGCGSRSSVWWAGERRGAGGARGVVLVRSRLLCLRVCVRTAVLILVTFSAKVSATRTSAAASASPYAVHPGPSGNRPLRTRTFVQPLSMPT